MKNTILSLTFLFAISSAWALDPASTKSEATRPVTEIFGHPLGEPQVNLKWAVYLPAGNPPWPAVLVIHAGGFKAGSRNDAEVVACAQDLADAGYLALAMSYRLAPPGQIDGQRLYNDDGRYPKQSADVQSAIRAARADRRCNGKVGAVGGSAGATHAAVASAVGTVGDDRLDVAVCLSGAYDFSDFRNDPTGQFQNNVTNYTGSFDPVMLLADSPVSQMNPTVGPLFLVGTMMDPMPYTQLGDMTTKLRTLGVSNFNSMTLPGNLHAFDYWPQVKASALKFLAKGFSGRGQ